MKVVDKALNAPGKCLLTGDFDGPFVDTDTYTSITDAYIYIHVPKVKDMGRLVGMVPAEDVEELRARVAKQDEEIKKMQRKLAAYEELRAEVEPLEPVAA